ncbi:hypothetical protein [Hydrogenophaga taeniospiralis]|nr:hypothetical protein [Hydrogenophaga taeniospiralis]
MDVMHAPGTRWWRDLAAGMGWHRVLQAVTAALAALIIASQP